MISGSRENNVDRITFLLGLQLDQISSWSDAHELALVDGEFYSVMRRSFQPSWPCLLLSWVQLL